MSKQDKIEEAQDWLSGYQVAGRGTERESAQLLLDYIAKLEAENEALWMYYKANRNSDFDLFKEAEKRLEALGCEIEEDTTVASSDGAER